MQGFKKGKKFIPTGKKVTVEDIENQFHNEGIEVDRGYGKIMLNGLYYQTGVQGGVDKDQAEYIKDNLGYEVVESKPMNHYFTDVLFRKTMNLKKSK